MVELKYSLAEPFQRRIPYVVWGVRMRYCDGDPSKIFVQYAHDESVRWNLLEVQALRLDQPTSELWVINAEAQPGKTLILFLMMDWIDLVLVEVAAPIKALSLRTGVINVGPTPIQGPDIQAAPGRAIVLMADEANPDVIYVGYDANVTPNDGFPLTPGSGLQLMVDNLDSLWFVSPTADQKLRYVVEVIS